MHDFQAGHAHLTELQIHHVRQTNLGFQGRYRQLSMTGDVGQEETLQLRFRHACRPSRNPLRSSVTLVHEEEDDWKSNQNEFMKSVHKEMGTK